jgi:hypothetical protein
LGGKYEFEANHLAGLTGCGIRHTSGPGKRRYLLWHWIYWTDVLFSNGVAYLYHGTLTLDSPNGTLISTTNVEKRPKAVRPTSTAPPF